jgi:L-aminopeptidase/D-esterase-like protein
MGIRIGHASDREALTGVTVVLCEEGAVCGVDIRGSAVDTRQTEVLNPLHIVEKVQGVLLTGGSAFGLDAAGGVQRYLEERGKGFDTLVARVPIVPTP